VSDCNCIHLH